MGYAETSVTGMFDLRRLRLRKKQRLHKFTRGNGRICQRDVNLLSFFFDTAGVLTVLSPHGKLCTTGCGTSPDRSRPRSPPTAAPLRRLNIPMLRIGQILSYGSWDIRAASGNRSRGARLCRLAL